MTVPRKEKKREARREEKAQRAALLEKSIENELLERLNKGVYGDIYNYPVQQYENILDKMKAEEEEEEEEEQEIEYVEGYDELEEEEDMEDFGGYMKDGDLEAEEDDDDEEQLEEPVVNKKRKGLNPQKADDDGRAAKLKRKGKVIIEYEGDEDMGEKQKTRA